MILPYMMTAQVARPKTDHIWRIIHNATHLSITILLPDTDPPNVTWVLPNGQRIDGSVIDTDVPAGETLCLCDDFSRCGIDMAGCDHYALQFNCAELPIVRARLKGIRGRCGYLRDVKFNMPDSVLSSDGTTTRVVGAGVINISGAVVATIADINKKKAKGKGTHRELRIAYAPNVTGDLADLNIVTQHFHRVPNADFTAYLPVNPQNGNFVMSDQKTIIHHTGVHGHCDLSNASPGHFGFYGNPNMTPDDYDQTCITLAASMQRLQYSNALSTLLFNPNDFILDISNRRTSASDEAIATLRSLGMIVNEIED